MVRKAFKSLLSDSWSYVSGRSKLEAGDTKTRQWAYPIDCRFMLADPNLYFGPFNAEGLPMQMMGAVGKVHVPSRTAAFAFAHWDRWEVYSAADSLKCFLGAADWFASFGDGRIWHDFPLIEMQRPWLSALAQGQALSVFARAYQHEGCMKWLELADSAFNWMEKPVSEGGLLDRFSDRTPFLEEYPNSRHRHVLNGCLFALVGIDDYLRVVGDRPGATRARELSRDVADAVEAHMTGWERRGWSLYQWVPEGKSQGNFNTPAYQKVHIALFEHLGTRWERPAFAAAAARLRRGLRSPWLRLWALTQKLRYRMKAGW